MLLMLQTGCIEDGTFVRITKSSGGNSRVPWSDVMAKTNGAVGIVCGGSADVGISVVAVLCKQEPDACCVWTYANEELRAVPSADVPAEQRRQLQAARAASFHRAVLDSSRTAAAATTSAVVDKKRKEPMGDSAFSLYSLLGGSSGGVFSTLMHDVADVYSRASGSAELRVDTNADKYETACRVLDWYAHAEAGTRLLFMRAINTVLQRQTALAIPQHTELTEGLRQLRAFVDQHLRADE